MPLSPWAKLFAVKHWREGHDTAAITALLRQELRLDFLEIEVYQYLVEAGFIKR